MIYKNLTVAEAFAMPEPKHVLLNNNLATVFTGADMPIVNNVPAMVSMRQARLALLQAGLLHSIDAAITTMPEAAQIEWEYATDIARDYPLLLQVQAAMSVSDQQMDDLFIAASNIK